MSEKAIFAILCPAVSISEVLDKTTKIDGVEGTVYINPIQDMYIIHQDNQFECLEGQRLHICMFLYILWLEKFWCTGSMIEFFSLVWDYVLENFPSNI